ncbi:MAG: Na+/H+ antiporter NhaC family protein, partial [Oscillospiraceae bacterium]|nr:Na+/H+ antiporter NhaC family protein [Oscillospiraceae bacterium]
MILIVMILAVTCITAFATEGDAPASPFYATAMSLLPPVIAIVLALITKEVYSSLFIGILAGGLLATNFSIAGTVDAVVGDGLIAAVSGSAGIFIFLVILGILVALLNRTGASAAFGKWAQTHIKTRVGAALATFAFGVLLFIDDYFNCLTVGSVMQPVTDSHKISRAKLSFLIDATAAPICMIAPISSWAAAVASYSEGTGYSGLELFIRAIPYNFYSLLMIAFIIFIALMKFDFGPMKLHERNALENGDLFTSGSEHDATDGLCRNEKGRVIDLLIPIIVLIVISVIGLIYVGGFFGGETFIDAFANTDATVGLPWGGLIALIITIVYLLVRRVITFKDAMECIPQGFIAMVPAILILTFAGSLKNMTVALGSAEFVAGLMAGASEGLAALLPAVIFIVACALAFSTGTSWGTFGILI